MGVSPYIFYMVFYVVQTLNFGSEQRSPRFLAHLAGYIFFAITSSRVDRFCSFLHIIRISSSATVGSKGVCFCSAVSEKLASKLALDFSPRSG